MSVQRQRLGRAGEDLAARHYERAGFLVVDRNWRCRRGELDLVVRRGPLVVFVEVKARSSDRFGTPFEAVTVQKQLRLRRLASAWLQAHDLRAAQLRFDVAAVTSRGVEVIESAF